MAPRSQRSNRGDLLLGLARRAIAARFEDPGASVAAHPEAGARRPWLDESRATFVTLWAGGEIRGCQGAPLAVRPLGESVWVTARAAAFQDLRFPPLEPEELRGVVLQVSVLSPPEPVPWKPEREAAGLLEAGTHGAILQAGLHRGLFLPYMWERFPEPEGFLAGLKGKAGLSEDFWGPEAQLWRFTVESHREDDRL